MEFGKITFGYSVFALKKPVLGLKSSEIRLFYAVLAGFGLYFSEMRAVLRTNALIPADLACLGLVCGQIRLDLGLYVGAIDKSTFSSRDPAAGYFFFLGLRNIKV